MSVKDKPETFEAIEITPKSIRRVTVFKSSDEDLVYDHASKSYVKRKDKLQK